MKIDGAVILVTGAASGLGAATARHLAARGAKVGVLDRDAASATALAAEIGGLPLTADVADPGAMADAIATAAALGPLRAAVNCAGIGVPGRILRRDGPMDLDEFDRTIRVNLTGTFNMLRLAAAEIAKAPPDDRGERGAIVNTASLAAFDGQLGQAAYAASKGGVVALALPAARELARFGIRVNTIAPGLFATPLMLALPEDVGAAITAAIPFPPRLGDPGEFAAAVQFCLENTYLNAEVIRLDGALRLPPK